MRYGFLGLMLVGVFITGCTRNAQPATPAEQEAQEEMMRNVLTESSPRGLNEHAKVTDEFKSTFSTGSRVQDNNKNQSSEDVPLTQQSEDDEESWW